MNDIIRLVWHFGGLAMVVAGTWELWGWAAVLIVLGIWAMLGTLVDIAVSNVRLLARGMGVRDPGKRAA
jgi:hypothetical protein